VEVLSCQLATAVAAFASCQVFRVSNAPLFFTQCFGGSVYIRGPVENAAGGFIAVIPGIEGNHRLGCGSECLIRFMASIGRSDSKMESLSNTFLRALIW
jgi:hypothetical protein